MKAIGILGGMGWESTAVYYRIINQEVRRRLGGFHSAHILLESFDFADLTAAQECGDWDRVQATLAAGAQRLERAGADFWLMACNTVHRVSDALEAAVEIPLLHIADPAGRALEARGVGRVALLGTLHTMQGSFFQRRLKERFAIETLVPSERDQARLHRLILEELVHGVASRQGRRTLDDVAAALARRGCEATLLACTELGLLYEEAEPCGGSAEGGPVLDTARLHSLAAVDLAT